MKHKELAAVCVKAGDLSLKSRAHLIARLCTELAQKHRALLSVGVDIYSGC